MKIIRDKQQGMVYSWEGVNVAPHDCSPLPFADIQEIVNYVWKQEGLQYPPMVEPLPKNSQYAGDATRTTVRFPESGSYTWIVLHELAHSMTSDHEHNSNHHGALFMGVYLQLLHRFMKMDIHKLMKSAESYGLRVKLDARPVFLLDKSDSL